MNAFNRVVLVILLLLGMVLCPLVLVLPVPTLRTIAFQASSLADLLDRRSAGLTLLERAGGIPLGLGLGDVAIGCCLGDLRGRQTGLLGLGFGLLLFGTLRRASRARSAPSFPAPDAARAAALVPPVMRFSCLSILFVAAGGLVEVVSITLGPSGSIWIHGTEFFPMFTVWISLAAVSLSKSLVRALPLIGVAVGASMNKLLTTRVGRRVDRELRLRATLTAG